MPQRGASCRWALACLPSHPVWPTSIHVDRFAVLALVSLVPACSEDSSFYYANAEPIGGGNGSAATSSASASSGGAMVGFADFAEAGAWLGANCGVAGCHVSYPPHLSNADMAYLQQILTTYAASGCGNALMVVPGDPDSSALFMSVAGTCADVLMPFGCTTPPNPPCLSEAVLADIRGWISRSDPFQ